jgi:hypothetical protein
MEPQNLMDVSGRRQCTAKSKQSGQRCKRTPIPGASVCKFHGGGAPQVEAKAKERLAALVDPAIARLEELLVSGEDTVAMRAVIDVLDRNGFKPKETLRFEWNGDLSQLSDEQLDTLIVQLDDVAAGKRTLRPTEIQVLERLALPAPGEPAR